MLSLLLGYHYFGHFSEQLEKTFLNNDFKGKKKF